MRLCTASAAARSERGRAPRARLSAGSAAERRKCGGAPSRDRLRAAGAASTAVVHREYGRALRVQLCTKRRAGARRTLRGHRCARPLRRGASPRACPPLRAAGNAARPETTSCAKQAYFAKQPKARHWRGPARCGLLRAASGAARQLRAVQPRAHYSARAELPPGRVAARAGLASAILVRGNARQLGRAARVRLGARQVRRELQAGTARAVCATQPRERRSARGGAARRHPVVLISLRRARASCATQLGVRSAAGAAQRRKAVCPAAARGGTEMRSETAHRGPKMAQECARRTSGDGTESVQRCTHGALATARVRHSSACVAASAVLEHCSARQPREAPGSALRAPVARSKPRRVTAHSNCESSQRDIFGLSSCEKEFRVRHSAHKLHGSPGRGWPPPSCAKKPEGASPRAASTVSHMSPSRSPQH